jgi:hypothetical protein
LPRNKLRFLWCQLLLIVLGSYRPTWNPPEKVGPEGPVVSGEVKTG